jgi:hypothetical protein
MDKTTILKNIIYTTPIGNVIDSIENVLGYKKGKITHIFNPCNKCLVKPICTKHKICNDYQNWYFKKIFCKHDWKVDRFLLHSPTSLMYQCTKCRKIK